MSEMMLFSNILLPLMGGIAMLVFLRGEDRHRQIIVSSVIVALSLIVVVFKIMIHPPPSTLCISWLASAGPMCMTFEASSLTLIFLSSLPLLLIIQTKNSTIISVLEFGLLLIAFSMMQVALVSNHFMLRYVALEFVGLSITAAAMVLTSPNEKRWINTKQVFINLRIGDLALLVAIFLMFTISDSFDIKKNFSDALLGASDIQMILSACLLTGVWVKMAIWPLNQWRIATDSVKRSTRIWLLDICAPLLGAYLLYRSTPLLEMQQYTIFPVVVAIGYLAVISLAVCDARQGNLQFIQRSGFQLTSIYLVLSGFWIGQKGVWAFMLLWLVLRGAYLILYELESHRETADSQLVLIEAIHFILSHGLCFLLVWRISNQPDISTLALITLWALWWTHAIDSGKKLRHQIHLLSKDVRINKRTSVAKKILKALLAGNVILAAGIGLAGRVSAAVKGDGYTFLVDGIRLDSIPLLGINLWIGLVVGGLVLLLAQQLVRSKEEITVIWHRILAVRRRAENIRERGFSDPLDFYDQMKKIFQKTAEFIYQRFEGKSTEKVGEGLSGVFKLLIRTAENFTSGNLWDRTLAMVLKSSRNLQQMHQGFLRFNMAWLLVFIIGISVFVWVWYINGQM
jgi:hypothetical protein